LRFLKIFVTFPQAIGLPYLKKHYKKPPNQQMQELRIQKTPIFTLGRGGKTSLAKLLGQEGHPLQFPFFYLK
jgi:hypothetical protein